MLTKFHKVLLGLLGLQLVLFVVVMMRRDGTAAVKEAPLLAGFDAEKVTRVRVYADGGEKPAVELVKKGAAWVVASHFDYPADATKVKNALSPLGKMAAAEPIVKSASRHKQLRVAEKEFDRKIVLEVGGKETTIYTGGPAGSRRTAVRLGDDKVYAAKGVSPFGSEPSAFVNTKYVEIPRSEVVKVAVQRDGHAIEVERVVAAAPAAAAGAGSGSAGAAAGSAAGPAAGSGSGADAGSGSAAAPAETWKLSIDGAAVTLAAGESLDTDAIERLVGQAASIDLRAPGDPKRDASKPTATVTIQRKGAPQPTVLDAILEPAPAPAAGASGPAPGGESYWIHQRGLDRAILADKSQLGDLLGADRDKLVKKPPPPPAPPAGAGSGSAATLPGALPGPGPGAAPIVPPLPPR